MHLQTKICRIKVKSAHTHAERDAYCIVLKCKKAEIKRQTNFVRLNCCTHYTRSFSFTFVQPGCEFIKFFILLIFRNVSLVHFEIFYAKIPGSNISKSHCAWMFEKSTSATRVNNILSLACLPAWVITLFLVFLFRESVCLNVRFASVCMCLQLFIPVVDSFEWNVTLKIAELKRNKLERA